MHHQRISQGDDVLQAIRNRISSSGQSFSSSVKSCSQIAIQPPSGKVMLEDHVLQCARDGRSLFSFLAPSPRLIALSPLRHFPCSLSNGDPSRAASPFCIAKHLFGLARIASAHRSLIAYLDPISACKYYRAQERAVLAFRIHGSSAPARESLGPATCELRICISPGHDCIQNVTNVMQQTCSRQLITSWR